jgi:hypothetical protein
MVSSGVFVRRSPHFSPYLATAKTLQTKFITDKIEIDGKLDESIGSQQLLPLIL